MSEPTRWGSPAYWSTPMLKGRLQQVVAEMDVASQRKSQKLSDLVEWVIHELPALAPDDPRTAEAMAIARVWWKHERSSK